MLHTTITADKQTISFDIPEGYVGKEIEVIVFAKDEGKSNEPFIEKKVSFAALALDTKGYKFNREEANER